MTDEFVDFYEILELPIEAERSEVRKRIGELYIEAQKNLDHRNFNTRVHYQQLFEIILPQARYIILDEGRRADYDRLVRASRGPSASSGGSINSGSPNAATAGERSSQKPEAGQGIDRYKMAPTGIPGEVPRIEALLDEVDPQQLEREREELWNKWKAGLQSTMEREAAKDKTREAGTPHAVTTPRAARIQEVQSGASQPQIGRGEPATPGSSPRPSSASRPQRPKVKFDFGGGEEKTQQTDTSAAASDIIASVTPIVAGFDPQQIEENRVNQKRDVIRAELENTGLKGLLIGAAIVLLPGIIAMTIFMSHFYPANKVSTLPIKSAGLAWLLWLVILGGLAFLCAHLLSKSMRRKLALDLQLLSYEDLMLRRRNRT